MAFSQAVFAPVKHSTNIDMQSSRVENDASDYRAQMRFYLNCKDTSKYVDSKVVIYVRPKTPIHNASNVFFEMPQRT